MMINTETQKMLLDRNWKVLVEPQFDDQVMVSVIKGSIDGNGIRCIGQQACHYTQVQNVLENILKDNE